MLLSRIFLSVSLSLLLVTVSSTAFAQNPTQVNWKTRPAKEIAPGYLIRIRCDEDEKLNGDFRVAFDGTVALPYGVLLDTAGLEVRDFNSRLTQEYRRFFKTAPSIQVAVVEKKYWVDVRGLVQKAGKYLVGSESSLDEIIAKAGALRTGEGPTAEFVKIDQLGTSATLKLSDYYRGVADALIPQWQGGEIVFFQSEGIAGSPVTPVTESNIQLLGQVSAPGEYRIKPGADFLYYLIKAGGPADGANLEHIEVIRIENAKRKSISFSLEDIEDLPDIRSGDIVMVHPYREQRSIMNFTSIISAITSIALLFLV